MSLVLPGGHLRTLSYATFANTVGSGLWTAGFALFLTRGAGLSAASVGAGLTIAGLIGLVASVPLGHLADRRDPRSVRALLQVLLATAVYTVGDLLHATAAAGLSYDLATPDALGQYQGAHVLLTGLAEAAAPAVLTVALLDGGTWPAWAMLGAVFLGAGVVMPALVHRAVATRPA